MGNILIDQSTPEKSISLSVNADSIRQAQSEQWLAENRNALEDYNRRIEAHGTFSNSLRRF